MAALRNLVFAAGILFAWALGGCTSISISDAAKLSVRQQRLGVAYLLGDQFTGIYSGVTVFGNEGFVAQVPDWRVDQAGTEILEKALSSRGYATARLDLGGAAVDTFYYAPKRKLDQGTRVDEKRLLALAKGQGFSTVAVLKRTQGNTEDGFEALMNGSAYGYMVKNPMGLKLRCVYTPTDVWLIDVSSGKNAAWAHSPTCLGMSEDKPPEWKDSFDAYTSEEKAQLRAQLIGRLQRQIDAAVADMQL